MVSYCRIGLIRINTFPVLKIAMFSDFFGVYLIFLLRLIDIRFRNVRLGVLFFFAYVVNFF
jgi:hypothetical protein